MDRQMDKKINAAGRQIDGRTDWQFNRSLLVSQCDEYRLVYDLELCVCNVQSVSAV